MIPHGDRHELAFFISADISYSTVLHCTRTAARSYQRRNNVNAVNKQKRIHIHIPVCFRALRNVQSVTQARP